MNLFPHRRPAVTRPVEEIPKRTTDPTVALELDVAMLQVMVASYEKTIGELNSANAELSCRLRVQRDEHREELATRVLVDDLPAGDLRRELAQERRNNLALTNQLAEARDKRAVPVRFGGWAS